MTTRLHRLYSRKLAGKYLESAVNVVDEPELLDNTHSLSKPNEYPAGEELQDQNGQPEMDFGKMKKIEGGKEDEEVSKGVILALKPTYYAANKIAELMPSMRIDPSYLHITLVYLGKNLDESTINKIKSVAAHVCDAHEPMRCKLQGLGLFDHFDDDEKGYPFYASVDAVGMAALRTDLAESLVSEGVELPSEYDFTPHMTLGYIGRNDASFRGGSPGVRWTSNEVILMVGDEHTKFQLGDIEEANEEDSMEKEAGPVKPEDLENVPDETRVMMDDLLEKGFKLDQRNDKQVYEELHNTNPQYYASASYPVRTQFGDALVSVNPYQVLVYFEDYDVLFNVQTSSSSLSYSKSKNYVTPTIIKTVDYSISVGSSPEEVVRYYTKGQSTPLTPINVELADYLAQFVTSPINKQNRPQIGEELHKILHLASKTAGGFGINLDEITSPSGGQGFIDNPSDNHESENDIEDVDLKLGEVEAPYTSGDGPLSPHIDDDKKYNITRGAGIYRKIEATVGNIVRILGFPRSIAEEIHKAAPRFDMAVAKMVLYHIGHPPGVYEPLPFGWERWDKVVEDLLNTEVIYEIGLTLGDVLNKYPSFVTAINKLPNKPPEANGLNVIIDLASDFFIENNPSNLTKEQAVLVFPDGFYWVPISDEECAIEGVAMQHCGIGSGQMYSLRDPQNKPHVTIDVSNKGLEQLRGKQNQSPDPRYYPYIKDFIVKLGIKWYIDSEARWAPEDHLFLENLGLKPYTSEVAAPPIFKIGDMVIATSGTGARSMKINNVYWGHDSGSWIYECDGNSMLWLESALALTNVVPQVPEQSIEAVALPDSGEVDENRYDDPTSSRMNKSIPRSPAKEDLIY